MLISNINLLTQSAGNLLEMYYLGILRDYTPGFISCKIVMLYQLPLNSYDNKITLCKFRTDLVIYNQTVKIII